MDPLLILLSTVYVLFFFILFIIDRIYTRKNKIDRQIAIERKYNKNKNKDHVPLKYDGFSDEKERMIAESLGAKNFKELSLVEETHAPDYETAKRVISGNFKIYEQYQEAQSLGAKNASEVYLIKKFNAPNFQAALEVEANNFENYEQYKNALERGASTLSEYKEMSILHSPDFKTVKLIKEGNFSDYNEYKTASDIGASNIEQLHIVKQMNVSTYTEAKKILDSGFKDFKTYNQALEKGFQEFSSWKNYLNQRNELLRNYRNRRKDIDTKELMKELKITELNELIVVLGNINVPIMGNTVLFSFEGDSHKEKGYYEFTLNKLLGIDEEKEICQICFNVLDGDIGTCPKCLHKSHYNCISTWVLKHNTCPFCMEKLFQPNIKFNKLESKKITLSCPLCKKIINPLEKVIRCEKCHTIYHKFEFLEYIKVNEKCFKCDQPMKF